MDDFPTKYDPREVEPRWEAEWTRRRLWHVEPDGPGEPYVIVIPPPNVTGVLHMGHALNNTIQDVLIRWQRMRGRRALWVPGTDHAGIATQNVVERELRREHLRREDLGREEFLRRVWRWREEKGGTIIRQLHRLGASCDWDRERFTMDEGLSRAVEEVFIRLYEKGLIYRGHYIVNWCPRCTTALSDEESEHREIRGHLYHIRYPVVGGGPPSHIVVATTRPETLLGDTAVAMNPADERHRPLLGRRAVLPVLGREIPFVADETVDPAFGTGLVKVTPAHDPNDFAIAQRHGLPALNVMDDHGRMNENAGPYAGLDRFECRRRILADLERDGLLERVEDHVHAVGHCYRCHTVVEPRLSRQWFVRMKPLAEPAAEAVRRGEVRFVPERWTGVYLQWMDNIRDWCISRQIWWGHRIPVFSCAACGDTWAARGRPGTCRACGAPEPAQDPDVLDTWFSSWLWPFSVFGWPERTPELAAFYPTTTLVTASEIIFFWVARMIMAGIEFMGRPPFSTVVIHGTVRDDVGRKMSKSLGNAIDPLQVIEATSADALRSSLMMLTALGQDVQLSDAKFEVGRNFATKVWNAARFLHLQRGDGAPRAPLESLAGRLAPDDQHVLDRLDAAIRACDDALEKFRFNDYALAAYDFVWHEFCDWYVEYAKLPLQGADPARRAVTLAVLHHVLETSLRLLQPLMPFLTEELWHRMGYGGPQQHLALAPWPRPVEPELRAALIPDPSVPAHVADRQALIRAVRNLRADLGLAPQETAALVVRPADAVAAARLEADRPVLQLFCRAPEVRVAPDFMPARPMPSAVSRIATVFLDVHHIGDLAGHAAKVRARLQQAEADLARIEAKLANEAFLARAKPEAIAQQQARREELRAQLEKLRELVAVFEG
ncbi:MAG: valine--tRNA ligase [Kiritimatiellae bacterium]|nr:valine--tRNA ligase [Kiritimatiellia bacterium]